MVKLSKTSQGFTLVEMLAVLIITSVMSLGVLLLVRTLDFETKAPIDAQISAMYLGSRVKFSSDIWFNASGNVNHAQRFNLNGKTCIMQLGFGRYRCEAGI